MQQLLLFRGQPQSAAPLAKGLDRHIQRIADAQQQVKINFHIVPADDAVQRLRRNVRSPRKLADVHILLLQEPFQCRSNHTAAPLFSIITAQGKYVNK